MKYYIGVKVVYEHHERQIFSAEEPTAKTHGHLYDWVIGPFNSEEAANYMAGEGYNNFACMTPNDAERFVTTGSFAIAHEPREEAA